MKHLSKELRIVLEGSIDRAIGRKEMLRSKTEDRLLRMENDQQVATDDLISLFRALLEIQQQQDSIAADRYSLLK